MGRRYYCHKFKKMKIEQVKELVRTKKYFKCSILDICEKVGIKYETMRKWLKKNEGISLIEFCQQCRLKYAEELLLSTNDKIMSIAYKVGFANDYDFSKWYKSKQGVTASNYRYTKIPYINKLQII